MPSTRDRAVDAALSLVGEEGIRALTHARVDDRAGLARGSTSNWFRTRDALLAGVIDGLAERERSDLARGESPAIESPEHLVEALTAMIVAQTGPLATRTRARYALFAEAAGDIELLAPLIRQRAAFVEWTAGLLADIGAPHPDEAVRTLMATLDGLVLHRVTVDPDAEIRPVVVRAVRASCD
ncbi:TetR/AcrR family transcriptional regulator [Microbacterium memoriense]|uniref:TetR family transcriptional regulator n=1 Tax=Microbacterium memoriense TaxID=2978350 RepID=A0ABT2PEQ6_9MICO|nr:TetR family transcriptional regulator [Microbacterium memoriense]MCT9002934.1 TetR family transcriptional regulator [Microbacterium memoriense]